MPAASRKSKLAFSKGKLCRVLVFEHILIKYEFRQRGKKISNYSILKLYY